MDFNFDEVVPRHGTDSVKWDMIGDEAMLPLWVADMDFRAAPAIVSALEKRIRHGVYGYTYTSASFYEAIDYWWQLHYNLAVPREWILPVPGIIPALSAIIRSLISPEEKILLQSPVYNHFFDAARNCGREIVSADLARSGNEYHMDFETLEQKAADPAVKLMFLCNPHNPAGRVWTEEELRKLSEICARNGVTIISDEIHADLVYEPHQHRPFLSLDTPGSLSSVTCASPSKSFNLAGIQVAYLICPDPSLRQQLSHLLDVQESMLLNAFATTALVAAYREGAAWLKALKAYIYQNYLFTKDFLHTHFPQIEVAPLQGTYLLWLRLGAKGVPASELAQLLMKEYKLWVNDGGMYGANTDEFLRLNIACPRALLQEALMRLKSCLDKLSV